MTDDYDSLLTTKGVLTVGGSTRGSLEQPYDADAFKVTLEAGKAYQFGLNGYFGYGTPSNVWLGFTLFDSHGQAVAFSHTNSPDYKYTIPFVAGQSGDYFLQVADYNGLTGYYTVSASLQTQPVDDYPANMSTKGVLTVDNKVQAKFDVAGDSDWFKFHAEQGKTYHFATGTDPGSVHSADYLVYNADGSVADSVANSFQPLATGDYYFAVRSDTVGAYDVTLQEYQDDYSANDAFPGQLQVNGAVSGTIQYKYDTDRFKINLEAGKIYTFELTGDSALQSKLLLACADASGQYLQTSIVNGTDGVTRVVVVPASSGLYWLDISAGSGWTGSDGHYTLSSLSPDIDDYGNTSATATPLPIGGSLSGKLQWGSDLDMFRLDLQAGVTYTLSVQNTAGGTGGTSTLASSVLDSSGKSVPLFGLLSDGSATFTPASSGSYYLQTYSTYGNLLNYTVSAGLAPDDFGANPAGAGALTVGGTASGTLEAGGDRDWFGVNLDAGTTYWFTLKDASHGGGTWQPFSYSGVLHVYDAKGSLVASYPATSGTNAIPVLSFAPGSSGKYYVEVSSPQGEKGSYQLQAQIGVRDDVGNDNAHAAALALNQPRTGTLEVIKDMDVYKLSVVKGVTYCLQLQQADGASAGTSLDLMSSDGSASVPLRNLGDYTVKKEFFEASSTGDYYFSVYNNQDTGPTSVKYSLVASSYGTDDYAANSQTTGALSPGARLQANISYPDDQDWFKVHLEAGRTYVFEMQGVKSGGGTLDLSGYGSGLTLKDTLGGNPTQSVSYSGEPRLTYIANTTGDYYLVASGDGKVTGSYTLGMTQTSTDVTPPQLLSMTEPDGIHLPLGGKITLTFNESVQLGDSKGITLTDSDGHVLRLDNGNYGTASALGQTVVIDPSENLKPGHSYTLHLPQGAVLDLAGNPAALASDYTFSTMPVVSSGTPGDDYIIGKGTGQTIDGGAGLDTVYYDDSSTSFYTTVTGGQVTVTAAGQFNGDKLVNVERILFSTHAMALDIDGHGGQAYRLYQAAFNRTPDQAGVGYWINALDHGASLQAVAQNFVASPEFQAKYGTSLTDAQYVSQLYHNVLHRDGDAGGAAYWQGVLQQGAGRDQVLMAFSESPENQAALIGTIGHGFYYIPAT